MEEKEWVTLMRVDDGVLSVEQVEMTVEELKALRKKNTAAQIAERIEHEAEMKAEREAEKMMDEAEEAFHEIFGRYPFEPV